MKNLICLSIIFSIFLAQLNNVYSIKCKIGYGISAPGTEDVKYFVDSELSEKECNVAAEKNPAKQKNGCYKNVFKLSGGNLFVKLGCFAETLLAENENYGSKIFQHICTTDNCNSSTSLKMSFLCLTTFIFFSIAKFLKY